MRPSTTFHFAQGEDGFKNFLILSEAPKARSRRTHGSFARLDQAALTIRVSHAYGARFDGGGVMSKVEDALGRLEQAVERLERALNRASDGASNRNGAAKADFEALAAVTDQVAARLDAVIGRLDRALEG